VSRRLLLLLLALLVAVFIGHQSLRVPAPPAHYAFGRGPDVVILHGLGSTAQDWLPVSRVLARRYRVTLVDLPGHGMSPMIEPFSLDRAVAALDQALAETSGRPVILVGHSLGGLVAAAEALQHPERVRGLVLIETALRPQVSAEQRAQLEGDLDRDYRGFLRASYMEMAHDSAQGERLFAQAAALDPRDVKPWIHLAWIADLSGMMRKLQPSLLAVLAPRSWQPMETWSHAADALGYSNVPQVRPVRLEGCGHFLMLDRPAALAQIIDRFAQGLNGEPVAAK
jgi:pimeloyl-[acyl-carrier protein] methyl ester esterase